MEIFVGSLPFETTQEELRALVEQFGEVSNIKMLNDRETGRFRGIAFITMNDVAQGQEAINKLNGSSLGGRTLKVEASQPRENRGGFGGGQGGQRKPFGGNRDRDRGFQGRGRY